MEPDAQQSRLKGSKYSISKVSGSKSHGLNGYSGPESSDIGYLDPLGERVYCCQTELLHLRSVARSCTWRRLRSFLGSILGYNP